ncbi:diguanylate cyclase [Aquitalea palustris]|uniref:diguanylate cyclase n=1 Tax=Aquitalea palustris TaxID=2480983 RepID=A0A454JJZ7_9NEIS|nr:GGDEF domain-containing protein [Aquitalea palustris]RMC99302.1 diguanylate cyclase [Aquitalea palustris]
MPTRRLTRQLIWQLLLYTLLFGAVVTGLKAALVWRNGQQQMDAIPATVSRLYLPLLSQSAWDVDIPAIQLQLRLIAQIPGVQSVVLRTELGQSLRYDNPEQGGQDNSGQYQLPLRSPHSMEAIGSLQLTVSRQHIYSAMRQEVASATLAFLLGFFGLALLLWLLFNRRLVRPLQGMAEIVRNYQPGMQLPPLLPGQQHGQIDNELSELAQAFRSMSNNISHHLQERQRIENELASHRDQLAGLVTARTRELKQLLSFQQLIAGISTRFINIPLHDIDQATQMALGEIGHFMQVERCYLISFADDWLVNTVHEWCASGIQPTTHALRGQSMLQRSWACQQLQEHGLLSLDNLDALPEHAMLERQELEEHGVQSLFMLRIDHMGRPVGLFGCDMVSHPRQWQGKEQQQARLLGETLANTIIRRQQLQALGLAQQQLHAANADLARMAFSDGLTGIANRRHFDEQLGLCFREARKQGKALSVLQIDIDFFKQFNDSYGHLAGDQCLRQVALCIQAQLPAATDLVARVGGEEFAVLLPGYQATAAATLAEAIRQAVWQLAIAHGRSSAGDRVTISIGVASLQGPPQSEHQLMRDADKALYLAKHRGRNRVETATAHAGTPQGN